MEKALWTTAHAPSLQDLPHAGVRDYLSDATDGRVNLFVYGPAGSGKTAAVNAFVNEVHDNPDSDVVRINARDFFTLSKRDLADDEQFGQFVTTERRRDMSKAGLMSYVIKEMASYPPVAGDFKTLIIDNAEAMREDLQHALRRVMEQHSQSTQYIIISRSASGIIDPIRSRCLPISVPALGLDEVRDIITNILDEEGVEYDVKGVDFVLGTTEHNLRESILAVQTVAKVGGKVTPDVAIETLQSRESVDIVDEALDAAERGAIEDGRGHLDNALIGEGMDGAQLLELLLDRSRLRYNQATVENLVQHAADVDMQLREGTDDRTHLTHYLVGVAHEA